MQNGNKRVRTAKRVIGLYKKVGSKINLKEESWTPRKDSGSPGKGRGIKYVISKGSII